MKFVILELKEFEEYIKNNPLTTFFQSPKMDSISQLENWSSTYVGIKKDNKVIAATRLLSKTFKFGKKLFYAPRGLIVDYNNHELLRFFVKSLKDYIKKNHGYALHIDPIVINRERDINGDIIDNGIDNSKIITELKKIGFKHEGFTRNYDNTRQVRWSFELPLKGKDEETILNEMNGNTRRAINKAIHLKVKVRELEFKELTIFKEIMDSTSERKSFKDKTLTYYEEMYNNFHSSGEVKYMIAEVDINDSLKVLNNDLTELINSKERALSHNKQGKAKELDSQINDINNRISEFNNIVKEKGNHIFLAAAMFMYSKRDIMYYHSGSYKEYMNFFGQYLIQWEMIKEAISLKKECYNFYGIKGVFTKDDPDYGVYLFKKGFNGHVIEYIGDFYLPISPLYYLYEIRKKLKK